ncbi:hypothetical protein [Absidia glauca]|uniref:Uncharacterized protein n=1 Tax=Absidia glauca TaxID=4829 RepID=A0A163MLC5_ABSGL|nr:hypothetical protein [Absidia glauca]
MAANKRHYTGFGSPESMALSNEDVVSCPNLHPLTTTTTTMAIDPPCNEYQLSPNATTPAYAPCNTYTMSETPRPSTPPYSMTLAHYNQSSGGYTSTLIDF